MLRFKSVLKLIVGLPLMGVFATVLIVVLLLLMPFRGLRIRICNLWGHAVGPFFIWFSGSTAQFSGREHLDRKRPAIYVSNHTSVMDIFFAIWLSPVGTVGVAKKEILSYPFFGQAYMLSGHLWLDRGSTDKAVASLKKLGEMVRKKKLSIFLWPEGTRSRSGRLLPFKKGLVHMATQMRLPVVPIVVQGAYRCWVKQTTTIRGVKIPVSILPPIDTSQWSIERMGEALEEVHVRFREILPLEQQPEPEVAAP